jgi:hypothetical protein
MHTKTAPPVVFLQSRGRGESHTECTQGWVKYPQQPCLFLKYKETIEFPLINENYKIFYIKIQTDGCKYFFGTIIGTINEK